MQLLKKTIDLDDELATINSRIADFEADIEAKTDRAEAIDPPSQQADPESAREEFARLQQEVAELEGLLATSRGYREVLQRAIDEWDGTELVIRELSGAEARMVKDEAAQKAAELGNGDYTDNIHESLFMEKAVASTPPGAPEPSDIGDVPNRLFDWLLTRANTLNTVGGFEMGNSSLRERLMERQTDGPSAPSPNATDTPQT